MKTLVDTNIELFNSLGKACYFTFADSSGNDVEEYEFSSQDTDQDGGRLSAYKAVVASAKNNNQYTWEFSKLLRSCFINREKTVNVGANGVTAVVDYNLIRSWQAPTAINNGTIAQERRFAVNAIADTYMTDGRFNPPMRATCLSKLYYYNGYPLTLSMRTLQGMGKLRIGERDNVTVGSDLLAYGLINLNIVNSLFLAKQSININATYTLQDGQLTRDVYYGATIYKEEPQGCNLYYIRWINAYGGYDYYMFADAYTLTEYADSERIDIAQTRDNRQRFITVGGEVSNTVTVKSRTEYGTPLESIMYIPRSPKVEHYDTDKHQWERIAVKGGQYGNIKTTQPQQLTFSFYTYTPQHR